jgi:hypothetical protein
VQQPATIDSSTHIVDTPDQSSDLFGHIELSSRFLAVLESAWSELRAIIPNLPTVVMLVLSARAYSLRGHFARDAWRKRLDEQLLHEVAVHPGMFESPDDLLITILHEAAHAILWEGRGPRDKHCCGVSLTGYYHRKEFRATATGLGLEVHFLNRRYGHCVTTWPVSGVPEKYRSVLGTLSQFAVVTSRRLPPHVAPAVVKKQVPWISLRCACSPARFLRCHPRELNLGKVICGVCDEQFWPCV